MPPRRGDPEVTGNVALQGGGSGGCATAETDKRHGALHLKPLALLTSTALACTLLLKMSGNILAMSDPQPLAEWTSRYVGYHPQLVGSGAKSSWVPRVDGYARRVRDRWMYVLLETCAAPHTVIVAFEVFIDSDFNAFYCRRDASVDASSPIPERGEPLFEDGASGQTVTLPMTDDRGRALMARLLFSPFRLPSSATRALSKPKMRAEIHARIAPLWEWKKGEDATAPVQSQDGFSLVHTPLWLGIDGDPMRVWVGTDPFAVAVNRSDVYCSARRAYLVEYEPTSPRQQKERSRLMLAQIIDSAILRNEPVRQKYGRSVDIPRVNRVLERDEQRRRKAIRRCEADGAALCQILDSRLFRFFQEASLSLEGVEQEDRSEPLSEHLRVLGLTSRMLGQCRSGQALLALWAEEAEGNPQHFVNQVVTPTIDPPVSYYKAFRWGSKALANVLSEFLSHRIRVLETSATSTVGDVLRWMGRLGVGGVYDPATQILDIRPLSKVVRQGQLELPLVSIEFQLTHKSPREAVRFSYAGQEMESAVKSWVQAGEILDDRRNQKLLDAKVAGFVLLDVLNLAISIKAAMETKDASQRVRAMLDSGVAGISLAVGLVEQGIKRRWLTVRPGEARSVARTIVVLKGAVAGYYMVANFFDAVASFRDGDTDRGFAFSVAVGGELATLVGYVWIYSVPGSLVAPWLLVVGGVVAAGAYITATFLKDDPLDKFLTYCEWGVDPYGDPAFAPKWADKRVSVWSEDFGDQARTLMRVLLRLTASWDLRQWPAVTVGWSAHDVTSRVRVEFIAQLASGEVLKEEIVFEGAALPRRAPFEVLAQPKEIHVDIAGIRRIHAMVSYRQGAHGDEESLECLLMRDGRGITTGEVTRVS